MLVPSLSATELLDAASICRGSGAADRSVYLATLGTTEQTFEACATLPIGARDASILALRQAMFGDRIELSATCPQCDARLDVVTTAAALLAIEQGTNAPSYDVTIDGRRFSVRPINSIDLAVAGQILDAEAARIELARRCLVPAQGDELPLELDAADVDAIAAVIAQIDPAGDPYATLHCAECACEWDAPIDIANVLAGEIEGAAEALLDEIHLLAQAYHWSESAILALGQDRRRAYLARLQQ
jgi:hypothetical protein